MEGAATVIEDSKMSKKMPIEAKIKLKFYQERGYDVYDALVKETFN